MDLFFSEEVTMHTFLSRWKGYVGGGFVAGLVLVGLVWLTARGPQATAADDPKTLRAFMRKKLDASSKILEGLTTENPGLIEEGTGVLLKMSEAEIWNVITDADYRDFNGDFRKSARKLKEAATKKNFDDATLQYFDTVKSCVECHKYVRGQRPTLKPVP